MKTQSNSQEYVGFKGVGRYFGVSYWTARRWWEDRRIPGYTLPTPRGKRPIVRFKLAELETWARTLKVEPPEEQAGKIALEKCRL